MENYPYIMLETEALVDEFLEKLNKVNVVTFDIEASGLDAYTNHPLLLQFGLEIDGQILVYILKHRDYPRFKKQIDTAFRAITLGKTTIGHNLSYDWKFIYHHYGVRITKLHDTMITESCLTLGRGLKTSLKEVAHRRLGVKLQKEVRNSFIGRPANTRFRESELQYAANDVGMLFPIYKEQIAEVNRLKMQNVVNIENYVVPITSEMEYNGVSIDLVKWEKLTREYEQKTLATLQKMWDMVGGDRPMQLSFLDDIHTEITGLVTALNINNPQQALDYLQGFGVEVEETGKKTLKKVKGNHEFVRLLLEYRETSKLLNTYFYKLPDLINKKSGRLHTRFIQMPIFDNDNNGGASTGRYASANPNFQQIPALASIREVFIARQGKKIITADYSGQEIIIATNISCDPGLVEFYNNQHGDLHGYVASKMFKLPVELCSKTVDADGNEVDPKFKKERSAAKAVVFGTFYGQGAKGLAELLNIGMEEAQDFINEFKASFPVLARKLKELGEAAWRDGCIRTVIGRVKFFQKAEDGSNQFRIERQGMNLVIQGGGADVVKYALYQLRKQLPYDEFLPLMTVHDEIVAEVPEEKAEYYAKQMERIMVQAGNTIVPGPVSFSVSYKIADSWVK